MEITFCCSSRDKSLKAKTEYRNQSVSVNCDMDFKAGAPIINAAAVLGYNGMYIYNLYFVYIIRSFILLDINLGINVNYGPIHHVRCYK